MAVEVRRHILLVALFYVGDANHVSARELWTLAATPLLTTNHVRGETWTFLRRRRGHGDAVRAVAAMDATPRCAVEVVGPAAEADAWEWLRRHAEREYSFVDATSFAVMRRRRIRDALAFDGAFAAAGFVELRP